MKVYHVTPTLFLPSIARKGLTPAWHKHARSEVIFVEQDQEEAEVYANKDTVTLRLDLGPNGATESTEDGEDILYDAVVPERIEVWYRGAWVPLTSSRMKNVLRNMLR